MVILLVDSVLTERVFDTGKKSLTRRIEWMMVRITNFEKLVIRTILTF